MFELMDLDFEIPVKIPLLDVKVAAIQVDTRPSKIIPLPIIHIEAKLDIRLGL